MYLYKILGFNVSCISVDINICLKIRVRPCIVLSICSASKLYLTVSAEVSMRYKSFSAISQIKIFNLEVSRLKFVSDI